MCPYFVGRNSTVVFFNLGPIFYSPGSFFRRALLKNIFQTYGKRLSGLLAFILTILKKVSTLDQNYHILKVVSVQTKVAFKKDKNLRNIFILHKDLKIKILEFIREKLWWQLFKRPPKIKAQVRPQDLIFVLK